jgi:positive phototaxis protein PixI
MPTPAMPIEPPIATTPTTDRLRQLLPELLNPQSRSGEAFLRLQVSPELTVALPLDWIEETKLVQAQELTPIPAMPPHVLGLISNKGQVFWLLSLAKLFGLPPQPENMQRYEVVVIRAALNQDDRETNNYQEELFLGLAVQQIKGSIRWDGDAFSPINADTVSPGVAPFLIGAIPTAEPLLILNPATLAQSPI